MLVTEEQEALRRLQHAEWPNPDRILQVRTGKIKPLGNGGLKSAIYKERQYDEVYATSTGLIGDEQQYEFHGGIDRALHQYASANYPIWRKEKPDKAHLFQAGAFGENLVAGELTESNVCIGDIFHIGRDVIVEVSEARMPCYKLSQRFEWTKMSKRAQKTGRVGWYLRVLKTGIIKEGDAMILVKRLNPRWSVKNAHEVFHDRFADPMLVRELSELKALGEEIRKKAIGRLAGNGENSKSRLQSNAFDWKPYRLMEIRGITARVKQLTFAYDEPDQMIRPSTFGSYAYVRLRFGSNPTFERCYSVVSGDLYRFSVGNALDDHSRGGSRYIHDHFKVGDKIEIAKGFSIKNEVQEQSLKNERIEKYIFVVGGIGITAFLRELRDLEKLEAAPYEVHYAVRSLDDIAYKGSLPPDRTHFYAKDRDDRLRVENVIPKPDASGRFSTRIFCSGPPSLLEACEKRTKSLGYPDHLVQFESFGSEVRDGPSGESFEVEVEDNGAVLEVPAEKSLLEVLNEAGFDVPSSCHVGKCGLCAVDLCGGDVEHRGTALPESAKETTMLSCVSRGKGRIRVEID